ncbi:hypothetical protein QBC35DRAFT_503226 [Podospora australis]|uniref:Microbial-type PARG catalytic domain-containing protein n=1 Tax=Podospora australis TaxID=1536484 RepID=A0AAN6WQJ7_9PEZI|nr:hypothetical protein QBC35DRAFT_503226 [Podospora australis]
MDISKYFQEASKKDKPSSASATPSTPKRADSPRRQGLQQAAQETLKVSADLLQKLGTTARAQTATKHTFRSLTFLNPAYCPAFQKPATIRVVNQDTFNAAISLRSACAHDDNPFPAVVNFANRSSPGGGFLNGAMAQEEALCYRSSLHMSLDKKHYPLASDWAEGLYTRYVLIMREDWASGHKVMSNIPPANLPVVSVMTVAAIRNPEVKTFQYTPQGSQKQMKKSVFADDRDRRLTKDKMRLVLRMAAYRKHRGIVLGALGCGVFANPPEDVAYCWLEVLQEHEFQGNWWRDVVFAVFDPKNEGNYEILRDILHGKEV